jgi:cytochrome c biogenesis protein CcmG, thiol:disulfide interchange protein DsbE
MSMQDEAAGSDRHRPERARRERPRLRLGFVVPLLLFAAMAGLFAFALRSGDPSRLPSALIGKPAPATDFPPLGGLRDERGTVPGFASRDLASGKVSIVNFWASWCVPCVQEHPLLVELKARTGVDLYGVNYKDQAAAARRFLGRYGNPFAAVGVDATGRNAIEWGVYGMPETFVINGRGEIVYKHVGPISAESLAQRLIPAIEAARGSSALR